MAYSQLVREARLRLLRMHYESGVGHIGGNLSALDALLCVHHRLMCPDDRFVLAKGHAAGALYVTLWSCGILSDDQLGEFHGEGTKLAGHPAPGWLPSIPIATGSLGHGFPVAVGLALAKRLEGKAGKIFCLTSDGEWQEGSNWEALIFARHHRLTNLVLMVDANRLQGFGSTAKVASLDGLADHFRGFGLSVKTVDGHDPEAIEAAVAARGEGVKVVVLETVKGKGVSFMENRMEWHYLPLSAQLYNQAIAEVHES